MIHESFSTIRRLQVMRRILQVSLAAALLVPSAAFPAEAGIALSIGTAAPDFTLPSQDNTPITLTDYKGKWVVLYFYPKDMTSGCTIEAHGFQRDLEKI
jgi:peroxiredoxin Q/BCP